MALSFGLLRRSGRIGSLILRSRFHHSDALSKETPIGFVGLGNMGGHMAKNLIRSGYSLIVHDLNADSVADLKNSGASSASSPADVAQQTSCIITMLPQSDHVKAVYTGDGGIFKSVKDGTLLIDSSTIEPGVSKQMAQLAKEKGADFFDAPVSGGVGAARDAKLTFMVGGGEDHFPVVKDLLALMGKSVVHCGPNGTGQAAKICNNMLLGISMIGTAEAMNLGVRLGLDPKLLASIVNTSSGRCWSSDTYNPCPGVMEGVPSSNNYDGGFGAALMRKDLGLAQSAASDLNTTTPLGKHALELYTNMCSSDLAKKDFSVVYKYLQEQ
ncbi:3-hydroxyisobutyrate dehydrogenase, mitochondrial-like [Sycon ciliatum]|uniref:3-hydroxyisobutyrate dehydrogenase, mitochondrial-like n=1 Tax=Sycon ciliatum TaxID=27933 RepID=UPI0031F6C37C|eukprot:scpid39201/ scgid13553/ 3-hydroxyisobutyrate dehydrogenase, mitochondrial